MQSNYLFHLLPGQWDGKKVFANRIVLPAIKYPASGEKQRMGNLKTRCFENTSKNFMKQK
jgi:hypothetical protein